MKLSINAIGLIVLTILVVGGTLIFFLRKEPPKLYINELMAYNIVCCMDSTSGMKEADDWIELYNSGTEPVNIGGMYFSQNKQKPTDHKISDKEPELTTIPPGGYLLLWADGSPGQGVLHLDFKLDKDGEFLGLFDKNGRTVDSHTYGSQQPNFSVGRLPDGGTTWKQFPSPTPGSSNN